MSNNIGIKLLVVLLATVFFFTACNNSKKINDTNDSDKVGITSPKPTESVSENKDKDIPLLEKYSNLIDEYTITLPGYTVMDRAVPTLTKKAKRKNRYKVQLDGSYKNENAQEKDSCILMFAGDLMCQTRQQEAAQDKYDEYRFRESFYLVKNIFEKADFAVGNLECTLSEVSPYMSEEKAVDDKPHCNAPATYLDALRYAGFDAVVTANSHSCDTGIDGILRTLDHIDRYKFIRTGTFSPDDERFVIVDVNGIKIGLMGYATYYNTKDKYITDEGVKILLNKYSKETVIADVAAAKQKGAEFIVSYIHWGKEYTNEETEKQRIYAQELADAGVNYIIGSHPHALQPYDVITANDGRRVPCIYSMGNFVSHMTKVVAKDTYNLKSRA